MRKITKILKYIALSFACLGLIMACNANNGQQNIPPSTENNGRITIGTTLKARTLDPADSYELAGLNLIYNIGESLYTYKLGTTELIPLLATAMPTVSDGGLTYKIPVREGVKFHDGATFNAEAMKFSLDRFIKNGGKPSFLLSDAVKEIKATGEYELTITLNKPFAAFPALLAFPGVCAVSPQGYTIGEGEFKPNELIATGPYKLTAFNSDSVTLDVFADYWGEKPVNQGVDLQIYAGNSANLYNSFLTGAISVAYQTFAPEQITTLLKDATEGKFQGVQGAGTAVSYMVLNRNQKPLDKPEVRQAIAALMDRKLIVERVLQGQAEPLYSLIPNVFEVSQPIFQTKYQDGNIALAKELLVKAGFSAENPAIIEIWYPSSSKTRSGVASTLKAMADQQLEGIIQFIPNAVESATAFSNLGKGIYPSFLGDWYPDFLDADNYIQPFLQCVKGSETEGCLEGGAQTQGSFFYNPKVNELIDKQRKESGMDIRKTAFADIQTIMAEEVPYIPLWQNKDYAFAKNDVTGVVINPSQSFPFWTIK
ncbi:MAG: peptide ABC transporter substrate-binding protein [Cyanobacteria bacterium]|nr:peptide ABC transporter substrate-binding protein [Cyanobacteria bacterium CG_2015-16_32_12]NCO79237.1 peptide ABC transporter substrate-binding protein [Cyanobacteria bacterium CG_2015-22_32_23]NCQ04481.1 peptide ABC transporter substrate-binding protein [Cyanobacteria bacterium CG_2015-09_32_10]NCQ41296.1 peptide ABC transporter substrate-binding protein [Cyanobacteria bacterium CG_2015-04_32_10]NCS84391.1 peptide ABC transporter substrate-binding protein [Cyanobacteria bacterium CG_2015-0